MLTPIDGGWYRVVFGAPVPGPARREREAHEGCGGRNRVCRAGGRAPVWPRAATTSCASTRTRRRCGCCVAARVPIYEPGIEELLRRNKAEGRLTFTTDLPKAVRASQIIFIAVGTPQGEDGSADLQHVLGVARDIARAMNGYKVIVDKSTVPVGTADRVREVIRRETTHPFSVVSNPEFLKQGAAVDDFMKPDRVVIGAEDPQAAELMVALHKPFTRTGAPIMVMDCASAELSKYAANAMLATKISFMNEIANVCEVFGADVDRVRQAMGSDRRIGPAFLFPGVGYGGSCFPKDVKAIVKFSADKKYDFKILKAVEPVNESQKRLLVRKMEAHFGSLKGRTIAIWGLAFKPKTDDMREAPAVPIIKSAAREGRQDAGLRSRGDGRGQGPSSAKASPSSTKQLRRAEGRRRAGGDHRVAGVPRARLPAHAQAAARRPVIFDGRNIYQPEQMKEHGFTY